MKKILAFGASSSIHSINKKLATYAVHRMDDIEPTILDLNDFEMPIFSVDKEKNNGIPPLAHDFLDHIKTADGLIISFAEHNGAYSTAFKNIFDWVSRIDGNLWNGTPMFAMATSPGGRGGMTVLDIAKGRFKFMGGNIIASFSLPSFFDNFNEVDGITDSDLRAQFEDQLAVFKRAISG